MLGVVSLTAGASQTAWFAQQAVQVNGGGLYLEVVSGSVEGDLYYG